MERKKAVCILAAVALAAHLCACGIAKDNGPALSGTSTDAYPQRTEVELDYWVDSPAGVRKQEYTLNATRFKTLLEQQTGIRIKFLHPPIMQAVQNFELMIASNDLPDIIEYDWSNYEGGAEKAIGDNVIIDIKPMLEQVSPNLKQFLDQRPEIAKNLLTDQGQYGYYPSIRDGDMLTVFRGAMVRKDLLDQAGLAAPETIQEWDSALRAMKQMGVEIPLTVNLDNYTMDNVGPFLGAYDICGGFYQEEGKVKFGPYEENFALFAKQMRAWYAEGLLDAEFTNVDAGRYEQLLAEGKVGFLFGTAGGDMGNWIPIVQQNNPNTTLIPVKYPAANKGERSKFGHRALTVSGMGAAISTQCRDVEMAARLLDYAYSEAGHMLYNFGEEGVSYQMVDGYPQYTPLMMNPQQNGGRTLQEMLAQYTREGNIGPYVQDARYIEQYNKLEVQKEALQLWADTDTKQYQLPLLTLTLEENTEFATIMDKINTYRQETLYQYIVGLLPENAMEEYFTQLQNMGIERALEIEQAAYDRFLQR